MFRCRFRISRLGLGLVRNQSIVFVFDALLRDVLVIFERWCIGNMFFRLFFFSAIVLKFNFSLKRDNVYWGFRIKLTLVVQISLRCQFAVSWRGKCAGLRIGIGWRIDINLRLSIYLRI
jgi:hypothetical protein